MIRKILLLASIPLMVTSFVSLGNKPTAAMPIRSACPENNLSEFVHAETNNFNVYICGGDLPHVYVGIAKDGSGKITLPLVQSSKRNTFVALSSDYPDIYRYVLTPYRLVVAKNGITVVSERARWLQ